jgi:spore maturation protein CgeB
LLNILDRNRDTDAVLFINVPVNQLQGIPTAIHDKYDIPVIYYDSDMPVSLPRLDGFATGFRIYYDADLSEYDLFISNSIGGARELEQMGAKKALPLIWGTDPTVFSPMNVPKQDIDVFFYGFGDEYREDWMTWMLSDPSRQMSEHRFAIRGRGFQIDLGNTELLTNIPFSRLHEYCCRSKINLNIVRGAHASVYGSSSNRPFELAAMACCIVSNPYPGLEEWFEPGEELFIVEDPGEIVELYEWLLSHEGERKAMGKRARERVLKEHTYQHRAKDLIKMIEDVTG